MTNALAQQIDESAEVISLGPIQPIGIDDFLAREFPPREMLLAPWLPEKGLTMVYAPRGVGKTHFALGVAYAVASGGQFLRWKAPKPGRVLILDGEMPAVALQERMVEIVRLAQMPVPDQGYLKVLPYDLCETGAPDLGTTEGQDTLEPLIGDADLIIVDNISTICRTGKENEADGWGIIQSWALAQRRKGRSVLFVHHAGKGGDQRGTSKREDVMDSIIGLTHPEDYEASDGARFLVNFTKSRGIYGDDVETFEAQMHDGVWSCRNAVDAERAQVAELLAEGKSIRLIASETGLSKSKVNRLKKKIEEANNG